MLFFIPGQWSLIKFVIIDQMARMNGSQ